MFRENFFLVVTVFFVFFGYSFADNTQNDSVNIIFFSNDYSKGGFGFGCGGKTSLKIIDNQDKEKFIEITFDDKIYGSEATVSLPFNNSINCEKLLENGALVFKVKGKIGGEKFYIGLKDIGNPPSKNMVMSKCKSWDWFTTTKEWKKVIIPLKAFPLTGNRWREDEKANECAELDIKHINAISFTSEKFLNYGFSAPDTTATIFVDDIMILNKVPELPIPQAENWALLKENITPPKITINREVDTTVIFDWFTNVMARYTTVYLYGGRTNFKIIYSKEDTLPSVFCCYLDDKEWSGVTLYRGNPKHSINLVPYRETGSIEFFVKGEKGGEIFFIGILDDESDGMDKKVQVRVPSRNYVKVTTAWQKVRIPFIDFGDIGKWWDGEHFYEVPSQFDWSKVSEIRFSTDKYAHVKQTEGSEMPVKIYFADIKFLKNYNGFNNDLYWKEFKSNEPDIILENFEEADVTKEWKIEEDKFSELTVAKGVNEKDNSNALRINHKIFEYGKAIYEFTDKDSSRRNWSKHNAIKFDYYSTALKQLCIMIIVDSSGEAWSTYFDTRNGWQEIILPFKEFKKYEYGHLVNANLNGRFDLEKVLSYGFMPLSKDKNHSIIIDNIILTNEKVLSEEEKRRCILYNQIGYERGRKKKFFVTDTSSSDFAITDTNGELVFSSKIEDRGFWKSAGVFIKSGDFTEVNKEGKYILHLNLTNEKREINISDKIYTKPLFSTLKAFYFQRSGIDIVKPFAENWPRKGGHQDTACSLHVSTGKKGVINVSGGWYDAGDYGKYIVSSGYSVWTLLSLYELFPSLIPDSLNIPESGNKVSDLLDEVRFELEWMKKMQDDNGGVFFKVGTLEWDNFIPPDSARKTRYVIGKSTTSALNFSFSMAKAARVYKKIDKKFATDCQKRAIAAWNWAIKNPNVREPSETGGTGAYADDRYNDEFFLAATELYLTTGKKEFKKYIEKNIKNNLIEGNFGWNRVNNLAIMSLLTSPKREKLADKDLLFKNFKQWCDSIIYKMEKHPINLPEDKFEWGSNNDFLAYAISLCYAHLLTNNHKYLDGVVSIVNYIFGGNACGYSFVTGYGVTSPKFPHHRIMESDKIEEPILGFLVGGPNANMDDAIHLTGGVYYKHKEPALAYIDDVSAYACNEIAINWNATLAFVLGYLCGNSLK